MGSTDKSESEIVTQAITRWRAGQQADATEILSAHPELSSRKTFVLDLAYEEYCLRLEAGQVLSRSIFCERFPHVRRSLERLLEVHEYIAEHPELAGVPDFNWPMPGDTIVGFELERELGRGAFARVYVAKELALGNRPVVVKLSRQGATEASTAGKLSHPNVVPVHSVQVDRTNGITVICMPYLGEATLVDFLELSSLAGSPPTQVDRLFEVARGPENTNSATNRPTRSRHGAYEEAITRIGIQLADALEYMHSNGVIHRDLKPSNILLAWDGKPMLLDFNLAADTVDQNNRIGGTLPYMSPEQMDAVFFHRGSSNSGFDHRSDIFSLGVVLYELLTGDVPFGSTGNLASEDAAKVIADRHKSGFQQVHLKNPAVDATIGGIVEWCLRAEPSDRPQTALQLADAFRRCLMPKSRLQRWVRRHRTAACAAAGAACIVVFFLGTWLALRPPYAIRAYQRGIQSYQQGDLPSAVAELSLAAKAEPPTTEALYAHAMACQQVGDHESAISDLRAAAKLSSAGVIRASLAYCYALRKSHYNSVYFSRQACEAGYINANVLNNLGYCLYRLGQLDEAHNALDRAIELDNRLFEAFHNRAIVDFEQSMRDNRPVQTAIQDIEHAMEISPGNWEVFLDAANIFAFSSTTQPEDRSRAIDCLAKSVELGGSVAGIRQNSLFSSFQGDPRYEELLKSAAPNVTPSRSPRVVPPSTEPRLAQQQGR